MFEQHVADGEFGEALGLWRGGPLAEFAYEPFAQSEIARLKSSSCRVWSVGSTPILQRGSTRCSSVSSRRSSVSTRFASGYERS